MTSSRRGRVLMLLENTAYPQDYRVSREATALVAAGYQVSVISPASPGQRWKENVDGIWAYRFPAVPDGQGLPGYLREYGYAMVASSVLSLLVLFERGFDVVHAHNPPDTFAFIGAFYKLLGKRFVYDHHDLAPEMYRARFSDPSPLVYRVLVWLERFSCRLADHVIATNASYRRMEMKRSGVPSSRITIVRNGPNPRLRETGVVEPELRQRAGTIVGYVGVMGYQDGVDYLVRAVRHLVVDLGRTDVYFVLIGRGDAFADLRALASGLGLDDYIRFTGLVSDEDLMRYLSTADICVDPDPSNPFNDQSTMIKMMEYMAMGKPIVAFDLPEHRYTAGDAAAYVPPNDEMEFAKTIAGLMDDPARRRAMGEFGRRRAEHVLAWQHSVPHLLGAYDALGLRSQSAPGASGLVGRRLRKARQWLRLRSTRYVGCRFVSLLRRYGFTASRAKDRVLRCVETLARHNCSPTFPTPGQVVRRNGAFCRELQRRGAELAIHGYHHLDFRGLSVEESRTQFARAVGAYRGNEILFEGFRCPYLGYTAELYDTIANGDLQYGSNRAIWWDVVAPEAGNGSGSGPRAIFDGLSRFYQAESSATQVAVPAMAGKFVEIPVSLPDDLQLLDGLNLDQRELRQAWVEILRQSHQRGEIFNLMFHPESFDQTGPALEAVIEHARTLYPSVWVAQLRDVNRWWREKAAFAVERTQTGSMLRLDFRCSERATVLVRNIATPHSTRPWYGSYRELEARTLELEESERPWVGVAEDAPPGAIAFLRDQGYIVEAGPRARGSSIYLSSADLAGYQDPVRLLSHIEASPAPLVRFWRWPAGARSALCVTGDLDALSITDYAARIFAL